MELTPTLPSSEGSFTRDTSVIDHQIQLENHFHKISFKLPGADSPKVQYFFYWTLNIKKYRQVSNIRRILVGN